MNKLSKDSVRQADTFISVRDVRIAIHILFNMEFVSRFIEGSERGAKATLPACQYYLAMYANIWCSTVDTTLHLSVDQLLIFSSPIRLFSVTV